MSEWPDLQGALCPVCGSPLSEGAQFCGACGGHVPSSHVPSDAPTKPDGLPSELIAPTVPGISSLAIESGVVCSACGAANIPSVERCVACGASLRDEPAEARWPSEPGHNGNQP